MSGFQKQAMLKRAQNLGLDPVAEVPSQAAQETHNLDGFQDNAAADSAQMPQDGTAVGAAKASIFSIQETYTNPDSGLMFSTFYAPAASPNAPIFVCHHGAGSSAMSFWCLAKHLRKHCSKREAPGVFVYDARGHGDTRPTSHRYELLDFTSDFAFVLSEFSSRHRSQSPICLVGHSLGGAVLTDYVSKFPDLTYDIRGLVVVDIVEETAVQSLMQMAVFLNKRPRHFGTHAQAVQWHLQTRILRNEESAKISVPELLEPAASGGFAWKASLPDMALAWDTWFAGLSQKFLACGFSKHSLAKLLVLSSNETLDRQLTIGQMQGKFQLVVFNNSTHAGHFLHEDIPHQVATSLYEFTRRFSGPDPQTQRRVTSLWGGQIHT